MTTYRVANPRGIPPGRRIVSVSRVDTHGRVQETVWREGEAITEKDAFSVAGWKRWIAEGFVVEVTGGD